MYSRRSRSRRRDRRSRSPRRPSPRGRGGDRGDELAPPAPPAPPPAAWPFGGCGGVGACGAPGFNASAPWEAFGIAKKKKKKKKKKKRERSGSASSSSSSEDPVALWQRQMWEYYQANGFFPHPQMFGGAGGTAAPATWPGQPQAGASAGGPQGWPAAPPPPELPRDIRAWEDGREDSFAPPPDDIPIFLEPAIEEFISVPKALLGKIIGKQASTIIEIREKSGCYKVDARDQTTDPCQVKIAGTAIAVEKAKLIIQELLQSTKNTHAGSDFVEIPKAKIGMVIGLKGAQVNEIQVQTGTKIDVSFENDPCKCYIKGPPSNVEAAKRVLLTIAMQIEDEESEYIDLPKETSGALIGAQGSRIREFQEQSGARIDVDKTGSKCRVRLTGNKEQVANAKQFIMAEVDYNMRNAVKPPLAIGGPQAMVIPAHQPTSFPATLEESIARARAAAQAVQTGLVTSYPEAGDSAYPPLYAQ